MCNFFTSFIKKYNDFLDSEFASELNKDLQILDDFKEIFPSDKLKNIWIDDFVVWKDNKNSFCYLLEYWDPQKLWSIKWWSANKYSLYFNNSKSKYIFDESIFDNEDQAIYEIWKELFRISKCKNIEEVEKSNILKWLFRRKVFYMYNPDKIIPIFSETALVNTYKKLFWNTLDYINIDYITIQNKLLKLYNDIDNKKKNTYNFMVFIYKYKENSNFELEKVNKNDVAKTITEISTNMEENNSIDDEDKKLDRVIRWWEFEMKKLEFQKNMEMKKISFKVVILLMGIEISFIFIIFCLVWFKILYFSDNTLNVFIWATISQISGIFYWIIKYLFPLKNQ